MDELYNLVAQKANLSPDQAKQAVDAVVGYLKQKLPAPVAGQIDALLSGGNLGSAASSLGGLFGKK
jgi:hypothetical protein